MYQDNGNQNGEPWRMQGYGNQGQSGPYVPPPASGYGSAPGPEGWNQAGQGYGGPQPGGNPSMQPGGIPPVPPQQGAVPPMPPHPGNGFSPQPPQKSFGRSFGEILLISVISAAVAAAVFGLIFSAILKGTLNSFLNKAVQAVKSATEEVLGATGNESPSSGDDRQGSIEDYLPRELLPFFMDPEQQGEASGQQKREAEEPREFAEDAGYLGVMVTDPEEEAKENFGFPDGAYVSRVVKDSCAEKAGILQGDVITAVDGEEVTSASDLVDLISSRKAGDKVTLTLMRADDGSFSEKKVDLKLDQRPQEE